MPRRMARVNESIKGFDNEAEVGGGRLPAAAPDDRFFFFLDQSPDAAVVLEQRPREALHMSVVY
jgi:hypothetical protein